MATKNVLLPIPLSSINSAAFTGAYQLLSAAAGLPTACVIMRIINNSDKDVTVSYDGINDHDFVRTGTSFAIDAQTNAQPSSLKSCFAAGTKIYVKGNAGAGLVYIAGYFNPQGA